jgi:deferrochelatase/peroxidase EfeB
MFQQVAGRHLIIHHFRAHELRDGLAFEATASSVGEEREGLEEGSALAQGRLTIVNQAGRVSTHEWEQWVQLKERIPGEGNDVGVLLARQLDRSECLLRFGQGDPREARLRELGRRLLGELQPNIVQAHVRDHLEVRILRVRDDSSARGARSVISNLANDDALMKTALEHARELAAHRKYGTECPDPFVWIGISHSGYQKLAKGAEPTDKAFRAGMKGRREELGDPPPSEWENKQDHEYGENELDVIVLVGSHCEKITKEAQGDVDRLLGLVDGDGHKKPDGPFVPVASETGRNPSEDNHPREHFGFVDGRSQPLFTLDDIDNEKNRTDGTGVWRSSSALENVLVPDPGYPTGFGSYLVYRKLSQDTEAFEDRQKDIAVRLGIDPDPAGLGRAGALLVGRHQDGTPLTLQPKPGANMPPQNNFRYDSDPKGAKCPIGAHIRRVNPRDVSANEGRLLARRGQTYGPVEDKDVGLLFMAVVAMIHEQFELLQMAMNGRGKERDGRAIPADPILAPVDTTISLSSAWGGDEPESPVEISLAPCVKLMGGEYFFLPSIPFLQNLGNQP